MAVGWNCKNPFFIFLLSLFAGYGSVSAVAKWLNVEAEKRSAVAREEEERELNARLDRFVQLLSAGLRDGETCGAALRDRSGNPLLFGGLSPEALVVPVHEIHIGGVIWAERGWPLTLMDRALHVRDMVFFPSGRKNMKTVGNIIEVPGYLRLTFSFEDTFDRDRPQRFLPLSLKIASATRRLRACAPDASNVEESLISEVVRCSSAICPPNPAHCFEVRRIADFVGQDDLRCACELSCLRRAARSEARRKYKGLAPTEPTKEDI